MAHLDATVGLDASQALPTVRKIGIADLKDALVKVSTISGRCRLMRSF